MNPVFQSLPRRVGVAAVAIPLILLASIAGGYWFFAFVALISGFSLFEFYRLTETKGAFPLKLLGLFFGFVVNGAFIFERVQVEVYKLFADRGIHLAMFSQLQFLLFALLIFLLCTLLVELFRSKGSPALNVGTTIAGVMIVSLFFGTLIATRELFPYGFPVYKFFETAFANEVQLETIHRWGGLTIASLFATIWICDTAAYFAGVRFGRRKLFERVSPKKTWVGAFAGFLAAVISMLAARAVFLEYLQLHDALILGSFVGIFGQLGDLIESRFKRDAGVKDSSDLIPGHGGVYDRFDSLVFVSPFVYLYVDFVVLS